MKNHRKNRRCKARATEKDGNEFRAGFSSLRRWCKVNLKPFKIVSTNMLTFSEFGIWSIIRRISSKQISLWRFFESRVDFSDAKIDFLELIEFFVPFFCATFFFGEQGSSEKVFSRRFTAKFSKHAVSSGSEPAPKYAVREIAENRESSAKDDGPKLQALVSQFFKSAPCNFLKLVLYIPNLVHNAYLNERPLTMLPDRINSKGIFRRQRTTNLSSESKFRRRRRRKKRYSTTFVKNH
uniref:Uncharacterized protein n=1 Tax=Romanomermis culicivorax TaxID=13658 RepID=A0A915KB05_ROMCU